MDWNITCIPYNFNNLGKVPIKAMRWVKSVAFTRQFQIPWPMPFSSVSMLLRSDWASSCFAFSTWRDQPDHQKISHKITLKHDPEQKIRGTHGSSMHLNVLEPWIHVHWIDVDDLSAQFLPLFQMVALRMMESSASIHSVTSSRNGHRSPICSGQK
jgi:hypothetical protein